MQKVKEFFRWLWRQLLLQLWPKPALAKDVIYQYVVVHYRNVDITLRRHEKLLWDQMPRKEKQKIWKATKNAYKKGDIEKKTIAGKTVMIKKRK